MAYRGCLECLLKLLNFLLTLVGLAMVGYGIYMFVEYKRASVHKPLSPVSYDPGLIQLGRPMLMAVSLSESILDKLPKAWYCPMSLISFSHVIMDLIIERKIGNTIFESLKKEFNTKACISFSKVLH
uniref:Uncharacterized protein MANES_15G173600 n=1 Tax=Rhizophora mucronata TaxID=61149 RepID=A0A2P2KH54_RHIMU